MPAVAHLAVSVTARINRFMRNFRRMRRELRRFTRAIQPIVRIAKNVMLALAAMATAAVVAFAKAARSGEKFAQSMNRSLAIMSDVTTAMRRDMTRAAFKMAQVSVFSANQVADAYYYLASAGLSAKQSLEALPTVTAFAQAGMFDMAKATELLTDAQSALGLTVSDSAENVRKMAMVGDVLVKANTLANASVEQFSEALTTKAGAALKILGKDIEEGVAVLAAFADQGIKGSEAGTALNIVLRDLTTKAIRNKNAFEAMNVQVFDARGEMRKIAHVIADLEDALAGQSDEMRKATLLQLGFTDKSVIFIQTLLGMSRTIARYDAQLRHFHGTTARVASKQMTDWEKATARLQSAWQNLGNAAQPIVTVLAAGVKKIADYVDDLAKALELMLSAEMLSIYITTFDEFFRELHIKWLNFQLGILSAQRGIAETLALVPNRILAAQFKGVANQLRAAQVDLLQKIGKLQMEATFGKPSAFAIHLQKLLDAAEAARARQEQQERLRVATEHLRTTMEKVKFEWERFRSAPGRYILRALGFGRQISGAAGALGGRPTRFAEVSLARQAIQGASVTTAGVQIVHDKSLDTVITLLRQQNQLIQTSPSIGVFGP